MVDAIIPVFDSSSHSDGMENNLSIKLNFAQKLQGVIVEVTNVEQARVAEQAGASCIVIHPSRFRMPDPSLVLQIKQAVSVPVMARVRVGHFSEAQILEAIGVDYIDESELLGKVDSENYINKHNFRVPFACRCRNFKEALRRIMEGAVILWIQGQVSRWDLAISGEIVETVKNIRSMMKTARNLTHTNEDEVFSFTKDLEASYDVAAQIKRSGKLPVMLFAMGGIKTAADAALMMQLGCNGVLVKSDVFRSDVYRSDLSDSSNPYKRVSAIVRAVKHYNDPRVLAECSYGLEDTIGDDDDIDDLI